MATPTALIDRVPYARDLIDSRRRLSVVIPIVFTVIILWFGVPAVVEAYRFEGTGDFSFLRNAGRAVLDSPSELYDWVDERAWNSKYGYPFPEWYPYPAGVAYLTAPLGLVERDTALLAARVLMLACTLYLAYMVARSFESKAWAVAMGAAVFVWEPVVLNGRIGQFGMFVTFALAIAAKTYIRDRTSGAMLFGLLALKPSTIVGPILAVSLSKPRVWPYFIVAAALVLLVPFIVPGPHAFGEWLRVLYERSTVDFGGGHRYNQGLSSLFDFRGIIGVTLLALVAGALFLAGRRVQTSMGVEIATAFAILVGFLINPHSLLYDWGVAFVVLFLLRSSPLVRGPYADFGLGLLGISLFLAGQAAWHWDWLTDIVNPLTVWSVLVIAALFALTFMRKGRVDADDTPEPASQTPLATS